MNDALATSANTLTTTGFLISSLIFLRKGGTIYGDHPSCLGGWCRHLFGKAS